MPTLFDPVRAGDLSLANRIVMAPLTRNRAPGSAAQCVDGHLLRASAPAPA
jgi:N-ethylmaleimide reductase